MPQEIGWAVKQMWNGNKVRRAGWNGKGMWLYLVPHTGDNVFDYYVPSDSSGKPLGKYKISPFVGMKTADDKFVPWPCSQTDLLATDWEIADSGSPLTGVDAILEIRRRYPVDTDVED
ncbi:MAG TPA: DUF2829 domain-containing protein [Pseudolabrys sp.]